MRCQDGSSYNSLQRFHSESVIAMSFHVAFYFAASAIILTQTAIESVNGQCTTEGCGHDDLSMNIITEIQQQNVQALGPLNTQIQNIHDAMTASFQQLTSQHDAVMRSLQAVDRRLEEHDVYIKQFQKFHELLNASFQQMTSQFDAVDASLQTVDRNLENYQIAIKNQTQKSWKLVNGNEMHYLLTSKRNYKLRVDLEDWEGEKRYAEYSTFSISSSANKYTLTAGGYSGNAGDSMDYHNGKQFTTKDADNDDSGDNCALKYGGGGWWYSSCFNVNLNGMYRQRYETFSSWMGIHWASWHAAGSVSLKSTEMKLLPVA